MRKLLVHWILLAIAITVTAHVVPGVHVRSLEALAIASVSLGLVNALVRPILAFFSLPLTILSLGLFYLLVNGVCFGLAAWFVHGFDVSGPKPAILGALCTSVVSWILEAFFGPDDAPKKKKKKKRD